MVLEIDVISLVSLASAIALVFLSILGWEERSLLPLLSRLFAVLGWIAAWWTLSKGLGFSNLSEWHPAFFTSSQILSGFWGPVLLLFTLAYLGRIDRWANWWLLVLLPGLAGPIAFASGVILVPEAVLRESLHQFLAGAGLTEIAMGSFAPWYRSLQIIHAVQIYGFTLASVICFVQQRRRQAVEVDRFDTTLLALIYLCTLAAVTIANGSALIGVGPIGSRIAPLISVPFVFVLYRFMRRRVASVQQLLKQREALVSYLPVRAVDQLLAAGTATIAPQLLSATVVFTDIRGFTGVSENLAPVDLIRWLDRYFARMSEIILAEDGMVDKLIGDGVLAAFGVPTPLVQPCDAALRAARRMQEALVELNRSEPLRPGISLRMGIGIHYGQVVAGTLGGLRKTYTVLGDTVNAAKRIETLTKVVGHPIVVSRAAYEHLSPPYRVGAVDLGTFELTGKAERMGVFGYRNPDGQPRN